MAMHRASFAPTASPQDRPCSFAAASDGEQLGLARMSHSRGPVRSWEFLQGLTDSTNSFVQIELPGNADQHNDSIAMKKPRHAFATLDAGLEIDGPKRVLCLYRAPSLP